MCTKMLFNALFSEPPKLLGDFGTAEKLINQYFNKRQFAHFDTDRWNPTSINPREFQPVTHEGDPYHAPILPENLAKRKPGNGNPVKKDVCGSFTHRPVANDAANTKITPRPRSAIPISSKPVIHTRPMYVSKPVDIFQAFPYLDNGTYPSKSVKDKKEKCASRIHSPRRPFCVGARDTNGPITRTDDMILYHEKPHKGLPVKTPNDDTRSQRAAFRTGIPHEKWEYESGLYEDRTNRSISVPRWRGPRVGGPWKETDTYHTYPVRPVLNRQLKRRM